MNNINNIKLLIFLNALTIIVTFFLFKIYLKRFISKLFLFDLFLIINLKDYIITINKVINKIERFFDIDILLLLYLHYLKKNNILFLNILKTTLFLFIYNFSKIKLNYFKRIIKINFYFIFIIINV